MRPTANAPLWSLGALIISLIPVSCQAIAGIDDMQLVDPADASINTGGSSGSGGSAVGGGGSGGSAGSGGSSATGGAAGTGASGGIGGTAGAGGTGDSGPPTCDGTTPCDATMYCADTGTCAPRKVAGDACHDTDCQESGCAMCDDGLTCVDAVCCQSADCPTCRKCGATGQCDVLVKSAEDDTCQGSQQCDPEANCRSVLGATCAGPGDCLSGYCVDGVCCSQPSCPQCLNCGDTGSCSITVASADDTTGTACSGTSSCDAQGNCKLTLGGACSSGAACLSGYCTDDVCCDTAVGSCNGCRHCDPDGICRQATAAQDPHDICGAYWCNTSPVACYTSCFCSSGTGCDNSVEATVGSPSSAQCKQGNYCSGGTCNPKRSSGSSCGFNYQCQNTCSSGICN